MSLFSRLFALAALILTSPVLVLTALVVRLRLGSPVFFVQTRAGLMGRPFRIIKFRTMKDETDSDGRVRPDAERLTRFGRFLRSTSLDELPELWNVVRGDMALVGPRPLLMDYLPLYSEHHARRHEVLPGITGWAQVQGRNSLSWDERLDLDIWYVDHKSFWLDFRILFLTLYKVLRRDGISAPGQATMSRFTGSS